MPGLLTDPGVGGQMYPHHTGSERRLLFPHHPHLPGATRSTMGPFQSKPSTVKSVLPGGVLDPARKALGLQSVK